ncbi:Ion channel [Desulfonatronum thiosulfatophilum]|uniref:Ion channel n=1 Tax=Desulfonatronum thiosulfatophilum TaxID=617002 RepID=A0A1G6AIA5_9BACT|nr:potassium channel family protein [Desulfonatronum thiosulfatophilum]SDB08132.1 Ion channel [Desulfonatronum thiosulfatophilum]
MDWIIYTLGALLVLCAAVDVFLTVLYARSGIGLLSPGVNRSVWFLFRKTAGFVPSRKHLILSFCGPTIIVVLTLLWVVLLVTGFALIIWPQLGINVVSDNGRTPTHFMAAMYYSGYSFSTLGTGNIIPENDFYRILMVAQSVIGFSFFTLIITYFLSLFDALRQRNTFAVSLHGKTLNSGDPSEYVSRLAVDQELIYAQQQFAEISVQLSNILESHHFYPILQYFRFPQAQYSIPRILFVTLDTVSLLKTTLDEKRFAPQIRGAAVEEMWSGGMSLLSYFTEAMLSEQSRTALPEPRKSPESVQWTDHYHKARTQMHKWGVPVRENAEAGLREYNAYRLQWEHGIIALGDLMLFEKDETFPKRD